MDWRAAQCRTEERRADAATMRSPKLRGCCCLVPGLSVQCFREETRRGEENRGGPTEERGVAGGLEDDESGGTRRVPGEGECASRQALMQALQRRQLAACAWPGSLSQRPCLGLSSARHHQTAPTRAWTVAGAEPCAPGLGNSRGTEQVPAISAGQRWQRNQP